ncbi:MAG TPA: hypothetical protein VGR81_00460 [Candidatus Acidoferrales bacterium]|nr:hypothetical protein [Candidatus Acidoferrales bacterium]
MKRRIVGIAGITAALIAGILFAPKPAAAQQQDYYTYVSYWAVPRAQWAAFEKQLDSGNAMQQKLVADGTLVAWGNDEIRVHQEDGWTHETWMMANSRANLLKALEAEWSTATNANYVSATKHVDYFLHTLAHSGKTATSSSGYMRVAIYQAKPGSAELLEHLLMSQVKPMLDSAISKGTLLMYNIDTEEIHTDPMGAYDLAMLFPDGAAMDKFYADFAETMKANPAFGDLFNSLTVTEAHRDSLSRAVNFQHQ